MQLSEVHTARIKNILPINSLRQDFFGDIDPKIGAPFWAIKIH